MILILLVVLVALTNANFPIPPLPSQIRRSNALYAQPTIPVPPFEVKSAYVNVDQVNNANIFWWGYINKQEELKRGPIVIWLQGGPGGSSLFGDLCEIGPVDACDGTAKPRNSTWLSLTHALMFVDNPVGTGFSYVTNQDGYARDGKQISIQLYQTLLDMYKKNPEFEGLPLYVFSESYGGKMASEFGAYLSEKIQNSVSLANKINFKGVGLGDGWVSPLDCVKSYGTFLKSISHFDSKAAAQCDHYADQIQKALDNQEFEKATGLWGSQEGFYMSKTALNVYNFMRHDSDDLRGLNIYANTVVRKLFNISESITWGMSSGSVFAHMNVAFMQNSISSVDKLLRDKRRVIVFNGQLDIIVDTLCTEAWINRLTWENIEDFKNTDQELIQNSHPVNDPRLSRETKFAYRKKFNNLEYWRILNAGHMVPMDNPVMAYEMLKTVLSEK
ncbi:Scpep1 [Acrasis kona]|uniref:Carboxypeptidase n=1 Tax=Acrasis kona TaxID=1008807 RepID=A0AAW2YTS1_9EUKA